MAAAESNPILLERHPQPASTASAVSSGLSADVSMSLS
jgi:hypothetical protein